MNMWKDIYNFSERLLAHILRKEAVSEEVLGEFEQRLALLARKLENPETLRKRLQQQYSFDPVRAYQQLRFRRRRRQLRRYGVAAGIVLLLGIGGSLWLQQVAVDPLTISETIQAGRKKAILTLADGSVWNIGDSAMLISTAAENIRIDSLGLSLQHQNTMENCGDERFFHCLTVPRGGEFSMTLEDGTRVWLNAESEIHFPSQFAGKQRRVQLFGEAYFEVAKDSLHPFIVELGDSKIKVLGTSFNVRSYTDEQQIVTTLVEGSVSFENARERIVLQPGEQSILDGNGRIQKREVDVYPFVAWKEGLFIFRRQRLEDIMNMVSRWYNVDVRFEDEDSKNISLSGGMRRYDGFEALVEMIETMGRIEYEIKDNTIFIRRQK